MSIGKMKKDILHDIRTFAMPVAFMIHVCGASAQQGHVSIAGIFEPNPPDSVTVAIHGEFSTGVPIFPVAYRETVAVKHGRFSVTLRDADRPLYLSVYGRDESDPIVFQYLAEPGDSVVMHIDRKQVSFSGKGAEKYDWRYGHDRYMGGIIDSLPAAALREDPERWFSNSAVLIASSLRHLSHHAHRIPTHTTRVLAADIIGRHEGQLCRTVADLEFGLAYGDTALASRVRHSFASYPFQRDTFDGTSAGHSIYYALYMHHRARAEIVSARLDGDTSKSAGGIVEQRFANGAFKDKIMLTALHARHPLGADAIATVLGKLATSRYRSLTRELLASFSINSRV